MDNCDFSKSQALFDRTNATLDRRLSLQKVKCDFRNLNATSGRQRLLLEEEHKLQKVKCESGKSNVEGTWGPGKQSCGSRRAKITKNRKKLIISFIKVLDVLLLGMKASPVAWTSFKEARDK